ncbi:hypothetical protein TNIN_132831 [Trichonephila inaurata madagascariensis]|uniref:Uncharacterized protein n=1 Tax=Trichonephila inaurata madagascariensis TaxID=2747483 RepID=A0A8X7BZ40_9ARAC|nr:hypothetical protein TNIN_132831 [Trichonephila inaurata madagascariensis]
MSPDKQAIGNDYAFDNPYFKDDEVDHVKQEDAEKVIICVLMELWSGDFEDSSDSSSLAVLDVGSPT